MRQKSERQAGQIIDVISERERLLPLFIFNQNYTVMELSTEFINGLAISAVVFLILAIVFGILDHYQKKREEFENSLFVGQTVKVYDHETKTVDTAKIIVINYFLSEVTTDKGIFTFKQLLS